MQVIVQRDRVLVQDDVGVEYGVPVGEVMPREALIEGFAGAQQSLLLTALVCLHRHDAISNRDCVGEDA